MSRVQVDADALLRQCLDWERSLPAAEPAKRSAPAREMTPGPVAAEATQESRDKARVAALAAVGLLMAPLEGGRASGKRAVPSEQALVMTDAGAEGAEKPYAVDPKSLVAEAAAAPRLRGRASSSSAAAVASSGADASARIAGRADAKDSKADRKTAARTREGEAWFGMRPATMDEAAKRDIAAVTARQWLDPKRFYKTKGEDKGLAERLQYFHRGTVVAGALDRKSSTIARKLRPAGIMEGLLSDPRVQRFTKRTVAEAQRQAARAGAGAARKRAKRAREGKPKASAPRRRKLGSSST